MSEFFAQGDLLIERVPDVEPSGAIVPAAGEGYVLAEGEATGHMHAIRNHVAFFRDDGLARDIPGNLYIGHVRVAGETARIEHDEHNAITLGPGTYRVRRQRELDPSEVRVVSD
jgi:hypothetical protein